MQRTRTDQVAQLDLLDDDRAHVVLGLHAPGLRVNPHLVPLDPLLELRAQLVLIVRTHVVLLELLGLERALQRRVNLVPPLLQPIKVLAVLGSWGGAVSSTLSTVPPLPALPALPA